MRKMRTVNMPWASPMNGPLLNFDGAHFIWVGGVSVTGCHWHALGMEELNDGNVPVCA